MSAPHSIPLTMWCILSVGGWMKYQKIQLLTPQNSKCPLLSSAFPGSSLPLPGLAHSFDPGFILMSIHGLYVSLASNPCHRSL